MTDIGPTIDLDYARAAFAQIAIPAADAALIGPHAPVISESGFLMLLGAIYGHQRADQATLGDLANWKPRGFPNTLEIANARIVDHGDQP